jgi:hypothetical protein
MIELRLFFLAGLVLLGGLLALMGALLAGVIERVRSHRGSPAAPITRPSRSHATLSGAPGHAAPWLEESAPRRPSKRAA